MVEGDNSDSPSEIRTTFLEPHLGWRCAVTKRWTSLGVTSSGYLPMTPKKMLRSWA
jgi:hypothetical protein